MRIPNLEYLIKKIKDLLGTTSISSIGDGTVTGAISSQSDQIEELTTPVAGTITPSTNVTLYQSHLTILGKTAFFTGLVYTGENDITQGTLVCTLSVSNLKLKLTDVILIPTGEYELILNGNQVTTNTGLIPAHKYLPFVVTFFIE